MTVRRADSRRFNRSGRIADLWIVDQIERYPRHLGRIISLPDSIDFDSIRPALRRPFRYRVIAVILLDLKELARSGLKHSSATRHFATMRELLTSYNKGWEYERSVSQDRVRATRHGVLKAFFKRLKLRVHNRFWVECICLAQTRASASIPSMSRRRPDCRRLCCEVVPAGLFRALSRSRAIRPPWSPRQVAGSLAFGPLFLARWLKVAAGSAFIRVGPIAQPGALRK
jgi:hypothetical protein